MEEKPENKQSDSGQIPGEHSKQPPAGDPLEPGVGEQIPTPDDPEYWISDTTSAPEVPSSDSGASPVPVRAEDSIDRLALAGLDEFPDALDSLDRTIDRDSGVESPSSESRIPPPDDISGNQRLPPATAAPIGEEAVAAAEAAGEDMPALGGEIKGHIKARPDNWIKETSSGLATALGLVLLGMVLVQLDLATEGQGFDFSVFTPYELWNSFRGLVVAWSQFNAWVLLVVGLAVAAITYLVYRRWKRFRTDAATEPREMIRPTGSAVSGLRLVGALGLVATLFLGAYAYQRYIWHISLPVPRNQIGIAFTRQIGSSAARDQLAGYLEQMGHGGKVVIRDLPVRFDARDTKRARELARRIDADAVVIYREESAETVSASARTLSAQPGGKRFVAHIAFADPSLRVEIPVPRRSKEGSVESVDFRSKDGVQTPRLEMTDPGRLMEASAGILMYDQNRYLPAVVHLRNALSESRTEPADGLIHYYLGNAHYLIDQEDLARQSFDEAIQSLEKRRILSLQEHLLLAKAYVARANIHFFAGEVNEADELLKRAVRLREPVDKDQSALGDPVDFRQFHETFGTIYVELMDVALHREDSGAQELWTKRARDEAKVLLTLRADDRARSSAIRLIYRTGDCQTAYGMANAVLKRDPDDLYARRAVSRLAGLRSGFVNLESQLHVDALLERQPDSLPEHQTTWLNRALKIALEDPGFLPKERETLDLILEIDPSNLEALEELVSSTELYAGFHLNTAAVRGLPAPAGHIPTFRRLQNQLLRDPKEVRAVVDYVESARPYVARWAEEVQPNSATPLVYGLRLSSKAEFWLYNHLYILPLSGLTPDPDPQLSEDYLKLWQRAIGEGDELLASNREKSGEDLIRTNVLLSELWLHRYFTIRPSDPAAAAEAIGKATGHAETALELTPQLDASSDDIQLFNQTYISAFTSFVTGRAYYQGTGDGAEAARMDGLSQRALAGFQTTAAQSLPESEETFRYLSRTVCESGQLLTEGEQLLGQGEYETAVQLMKQYVGHFPNDPTGHWKLGWAQYQAGDLKAAQASTEKFRKLAPGHAIAAANLAIIHLAEGRDGPAVAQTDRLLKLLNEEPLGLRLRLLGLFANDLSEVAREHEKSHESLKQVLSRVDRYIDKLPSQARRREGARLVEILSGAGGGAAWAGHTVTAEAFLNQGLEINPDYVLLRANLGFAKLESGDVAGARAEYEKAIASGATYYVNWAGKQLESTELAGARDQLKRELEASASAIDVLGARRDDISNDAPALAALLRAAAAAIP